MPRLELKVPPPLVALVCALLMWGLARSLPLASLQLPWQVQMLPALAGLGLLSASVLTFLRARTTIDPLHPDRAARLVQTGCNRFSRNPMYLGLLLLLLSWALWLASGSALLGLPLFVGYLNRFQIAAEERYLSERFGDEYQAYRARVRRWL